jgi:Ca2+-binding RTX toxin-like protein
MSAGKVRLGFVLVSAAAALLVAPGVATAYETVSVDTQGASKTISIEGLAEKPSDLITASWDSRTNEYVITHDIFMTSPPEGCHFVGDGPPYIELRCPAAGVTKISIAAGEDNDKILLGGLIDKGNPTAFSAPDLLSVAADAGTGNDAVSTVTTARADRSAGASAAGHAVEVSINMGSGKDSVSVGGGTFDATFDAGGTYTGGNGNNTVSFGDGNGTVAVGDGANSIRVGAGNSKVTVGDGTNTASFGSGNSKFFGGAGEDSAKFGAGNSKFFGRGGADSASMGAGSDKAYGGPGRDTLRGGRGADKLIGGGGNDRLFGNGGFDVLIGAGGPADKCVGGGGGAKQSGCEH